MYHSSVDLAVELIRIRDRLPEHKDVIDEAISAIGERDRLRHACEAVVEAKEADQDADLYLDRLFVAVDKCADVIRLARRGS